MIFLFRLLPFVSAIFVSVAFYLQFDGPMQYPWIAVVGAVSVIAGAIFMAKGRISYSDLIEKMLPTVLLLTALIFSMLLSEGTISRYAIVVLGGVSVYLSMELLFFLIFMPSRYPVHGLSRVNIAYVPFIIWYAVVPSVGLMTFLHSAKWIHFVLMVILGVIVFRTTGHPEASPEQNRRWMVIGALTGAHLGFLGIVLPLSMVAQAALAMLIFSVILRMRRYLYKPFPSIRQAWVERMGALTLLVVIIITARWL